ncbi:hypothetical protein T492DRAFT_225154 [Pavlovales sp. CCMP2436]|nr:hypothetical protein T492DRAFT_225154 [Pavlovales sp. CCMP2436]
MVQPMAPLESVAEQEKETYSPPHPEASDGPPEDPLAPADPLAKTWADAEMEAQLEAVGSRGGSSPPPNTPRQQPAAAFSRPPPVSVHLPPVSPPAVHSAPVAASERGNFAGGTRPQTLGTAGALSCFDVGASARSPFPQRSPFVPMTISASSVRRARASAQLDRTPSCSSSLPGSCYGSCSGSYTGSYAGTPVRGQGGGFSSAARLAAAQRREERRGEGKEERREEGAFDAPPALPWGKSHAAAAFLQARVRSSLARRKWRPSIIRLLKRAAVARELVQSEVRYCEALKTLVDLFLRPLEALGGSSSSSGGSDRGARDLFGNARVVSLFLRKRPT